ncbi:MAG: hypothetical protein VKN72_05170 [Nostocales cyanobacterium 94392]|nr:hypothetical protein [Nostocales cyanobacterium 94392]
MRIELGIEIPTFHAEQYTRSRRAVWVVGFFLVVGTGVFFANNVVAQITPDAVQTVKSGEEVAQIVLESAFRMSLSLNFK